MKSQTYDQFYSGMSPEGKLILTPAFAEALTRGGNPPPRCMLPTAGRAYVCDAAPADSGVIEPFETEGEELRRLRPIIARSNDAAKIREFNVRALAHNRQSGALNRDNGGQPDYSELEAAYAAKLRQPQGGVVSLETQHEPEDMEAAAEATRKYGEEAWQTPEQQEQALRDYKIKYGLDAARTHGRVHVALEAYYAAKRGRRQ